MQDRINTSNFSLTDGIIVDSFTNEQMKQLTHYIEYSFARWPEPKKPDFYEELETVIDIFSDMAFKDIKKKYDLDIENMNEYFTTYIHTKFQHYASRPFKTKTGKKYKFDGLNGIIDRNTINIKMDSDIIFDVLGNGEISEITRLNGDIQWKNIGDDYPKTASKLLEKHKSATINESTNFSKFFHFYLNQYKNK